MDFNSVQAQTIMHGIARSYHSEHSVIAMNVLSLVSSLRVNKFLEYQQVVEKVLKEYEGSGPSFGAVQVDENNLYVRLFQQDKDKDKDTKGIKKYFSRRSIREMASNMSLAIGFTGKRKTDAKRIQTLRTLGLENQKLEDRDGFDDIDEVSSQSDTSSVSDVSAGSVFGIEQFADLDSFNVGDQCIIEVSSFHLCPRY